MFIQYLFTDFQLFLWGVTIVVLSVCTHEFFHALAAYYEGDDTAKRAGYFTINPMVHMGPQSIILLLLTGMCWGSCPVNPARFRHKYGDALVAFAGPFANLLLMVLFALLIFAAPWIVLPFGASPVMAENLSRFFQMATTTNAALFILNMIPFPPLDGHSIVMNFFPGTRPFYASLGPMGFGLLMILMFLGLGKILWASAYMLSGLCVMLCGGLFA